MIEKLATLAALADVPGHNRHGGERARQARMWRPGGRRGGQQQGRQAGAGRTGKGRG